MRTAQGEPRDDRMSDIHVCLAAPHVSLVDKCKEFITSTIATENE